MYLLMYAFIYFIYLCIDLFMYLFMCSFIYYYYDDDYYYYYYYYYYYFCHSGYVYNWNKMGGHRPRFGATELNINTH